MENFCELLHKRAGLKKILQPAVDRICAQADFKEIEYDPNGYKLLIWHNRNRSEIHNREYYVTHAQEGTYDVSAMWIRGISKEGIGKRVNMPIPVDQVIPDDYVANNGCVE
jgi:hypothetical protein